jgi:hypothetical protein
VASATRRRDREEPKSTVTTDVELRLRQAGITVLPGGTVLPGESPSPWLYVRVGFVASGTVYAYAVEVELHQPVTLVRDREITAYGATTWRVGPLVGLAGRDGIAERVRRVLRDMVDEFVNAYLAANPKR